MSHRPSPDRLHDHPPSNAKQFLHPGWAHVWNIAVFTCQIRWLVVLYSCSSRRRNLGSFGELTAHLGAARRAERSSGGLSDSILNRIAGRQ